MMLTLSDTWFTSQTSVSVRAATATGSSPTATFSTCFGAPFLPLAPSVYAKLLGERIAKHEARCWLVNTGWSGGPYGIGKRVSIHHTRAMVTAALTGALESVEFAPDPTFGVILPKSCPGVPVSILQPRNTWEDHNAYDAKAKELAVRFAKNIEQFSDAPAKVKAAGPKI